jgi:hypothetical protein
MKLISISRSRLGEMRCLTTGMPKCRNVELRNGEISARPIIYDPTVQVIREYDRRATVSLHS